MKVRESILVFFVQAEDGIRDLVRSRGLGDVYKRQGCDTAKSVLDIPYEELLKRTDLEEETVKDILRILESEFE